ncbi:MUTM homolog-1 [Prunus dulcis]|uniref:MUTM homolog-1 n=1 Tax=Prunus dulcis TaxID=3755 RepID=A0A4Y1R4S4_PRUDU|nr:MUTM homolog-1 [Prunus dulcis]
MSGMTGAIYIKGVAVTKYKRSAVKDTDEWPSKYSNWMMVWSSLSLTRGDLLESACSKIICAPISELGPDALLEPMTGDELFESLSKKKIAIKTLLLDQSYISGIGNWVADEVLYQARIHPEQSAASLSKENYGNLHKSIKETLPSFPVNGCFIFGGAKSPEKLMVIEKSLEVGADSSQFPSNWIFHSREKKPGKAFVDGRKIDFITVGGRTTAYVPELQKLSGQQAARAGSKQANKRKGHGDGVKDDVNEAASDEEVNGSVQSKKGRKPRGQGNKSSAKRKSKESDDEDNANDSEDDDDDDNDDHHDEDQKNKTRKVTNNKQSKVEKTSKKTVQTSQNSKKKKKAK